jgi:site-specific DNA recombinase
MKLNQRRKPPVGKYMLAGVLTCPECGSKMVGSKTRYKKKNGEQVERLYYTCSQFHNKGLTACHSNGIRVDLIDPIAIKRITKKLNSPELVDTLYKYITENTIDENGTYGKRRILELEIEKQATRKIELRKLYTEGIITSSELKEDIEKINIKSTEYQSLILSLNQDESQQESRPINITQQDVKTFLSDIASTLKTDRESERLKIKEMVRLMISRIDVKNKSQASMDIHMSFDEMLYRILNTPSESQVEMV